MKDTEREHEGERDGERDGDGDGARTERELRDLPARDTDRETAERVRRAAVDAFVEAHAVRGRPWRAAVTRTARALTPLIVAGTVGVYLTWAITTANALFGGH
jgi:hypothetical protein